MSIPRPAPPPEDAGARALADALRGSFRVLKLLMFLALALMLFSGLFTVQPDEVAVVLRFGKPVLRGGQPWLNPGLHWAFPYPIDDIVRVPVGQSRTLTSTIGWYAVSAEQQAAGVEPPPRESLMPGVDGYLIMADGNLAHARATLKYRVTDPLRHTFHLNGATNVLENLLNRALVHAGAEFQADAAIYRDKTGFKDTLLRHLQAGLEAFPLGVSLDTLDVQVVAPPAVRPAFEAVLAAEQERSQKANEAHAYASQTTVTATGEAQATVSRGRSEAHQLALTVDAEARAFAEQLEQHHRNPDFFRRRLLASTLEEVMPSLQEKFFLPRRAPGQAGELRLQLSREPMKLRTNNAANANR